MQSEKNWEELPNTNVKLSYFRGQFSNMSSTQLANVFLVIDPHMSVNRQLSAEPFIVIFVITTVQLYI